MKKSRRYCTVPAVFGFRKWFERRFKDLCEAHDRAYETRSWVKKIRSDWLMIQQMWQRGYRLLSVIAYLFFVSIGTLVWFKGKIEDKYFTSR